MTLRAIARSRARTRALGLVALSRRPPSAKARLRSIEREQLWGEYDVGGDDDFVAVDCRPRGAF
jgi:hypothetical protein